LFVLENKKKDQKEGGKNKSDVMTNLRIAGTIEILSEDLTLSPSIRILDPIPKMEGNRRITPPDHHQTILKNAQKLAMPDRKEGTLVGN
jgi:hypothetical protein